MNRRDFLRTVALATFSAKFASLDQLLANDVPLDENLVAIFSDIHLHNPETRQQVVRFNQSVINVLSMNPRPANLLIYGDLAYSSGEIEDYQLLRKLIKPIEDAGIKWHAAMGNHDRLPVFRQVFPERFEKEQPISDRYVNIVETPHADFVLLDSYLEGQVRGAISLEQQDWLGEILKQYTTKPVFVGCHHQLANTQIVHILKACPQFAAYLHGHHHYYRSPKQEEIQTICFPSVGHWGDMGYMIANLTSSEATFTPYIDAYEWSKYGYVKEAEKDVESYMKKLNANSPVITF